MSPQYLIVEPVETNSDLVMVHVGEYHKQKFKSEVVNVLRENRLNGSADDLESKGKIDVMLRQEEFEKLNKIFV